MSVGDERLKNETEGSTRLAYTGLSGRLEHLTEIEKRLIDERFPSVMGECVYRHPVKVKFYT